jgi:hypothetical protein
MGGAFQTSRDIFNNPIWQDIPKFRIFFFIVGNAVFSHDGVKIGNILVKRGQFLRSYRNLADDLQYIENRSVKKYSISVISRKIDQLVKEERLKIEDTELGTLFTVVNYEIYQGFDHYKKQELGTELEQSWNDEGTELEQKRNNNNNVKKVKKDKSSSQSFKYETSDMELAKLLYHYIEENTEKAHYLKRVNIESWANTFRLMRTYDDRTNEQIKYLIDWTQKNEFWRTNILSPSKLREKFDQLVLKVKMEKEKKVTSLGAKKKKQTNDQEDYQEERKVVSSFDGRLF